MKLKNAVFILITGQARTLTTFMTNHGLVLDHMLSDSLLAMFST